MIEKVRIPIIVSEYCEKCTKRFQCLTEGTESEPDETIITQDFKMTHFIIARAVIDINRFINQLTSRTKIFDKFTIQQGYVEITLKEPYL